MSTDTKAIIGTIVGTGLVLGGLLSAQIASGNASLNVRIDDLRADMRDLRVEMRAEMSDLRVEMRADIRALRTEMSDLRADMREDHERFDTRLRAVEIAFGKVDQRLLTIERVVLPGPDADQ